ncbi:MBOAT membrane-bound O-acyltransferase family protein [Brugia pahangi]
MTKRRILFQYPALPTIELGLCYIIVGCSMIYAWSQVLIASNKYEFQYWHSIRINRLPLIGERYMDESNWEWASWTPIGFSLLPFFILHSIIFNIGGSFVSDNTLQYITIFYSVTYSCFLFSKWLVILSLTQGTLIFFAAYYFRHQLIVWFCSMPILYLSLRYSYHLSPNPLIVVIFICYTLLSYISFNLEMLNGAKRPEDNTLLKCYIRMLFYAFYPPYMTTLVVIYPEFERQMRQRHTKTRNWQRVIFFALRITFWWLLIYLMLHFMYFEWILYDTDYAQNLPKNEFVSLGMALGIFFHLRYVVIFGLPRIFALADNMEPAAGPICINRLTLYSKAWRYFDPGLYSFFKTYIFIPICTPTFSIKRKIFGVIISYGFVLLWHGITYANIIWIILNIIGLFMEYCCKGLYTIKDIQKWRETHINDISFRRFIAFLHIIPFILGLYSNFYFLGGYEVGSMFVKRIWYEETLKLRFPAILLITLAYFYSQVCIEIDRKINLATITNNNYKKDC